MLPLLQSDTNLAVVEKQDQRKPNTQSQVNRIYLYIADISASRPLRTLGTANEYIGDSKVQDGESSAVLIPHSPLLVPYSNYFRMPLSISDKGVFLTGEALTKIAKATISSISLRISIAGASCSIELLSSSEVHTLTTQTVNLTANDEASIFPIDIGGDPTRDFYVSITWNAGQLMPKKLGLRSTQAASYLLQRRTRTTRYGHTSSIQHPPK